MLYVIIVILLILSGFFAFRYFSLIYAMNQIKNEVLDVQQDLTQNQMLHMPLPEKHMKELLCSLNSLLEEIQKERKRYETQEKEFRKQIENISHDLRTPLTVILGYIKLYKNAHAEQIAHDPDLTEMIITLESKSETMKNLVTQFYDYSRINAGDYELQLNTVDVAKMLRESLMGHYQVLEHSDLKVDVVIPEHPVWVLGSESALERIFVNLLQNVSRYADTFFQIGIHEDNDSAYISFINDTSLLSDDDLPHLFERFYMQDGARNQNGTGLGLTVAQSLAKEMGGVLSVEKIEHPDGLDCSGIVVCFHLKVRRL